MPFIESKNFAEIVPFEFEESRNFEQHILYTN